MAAVAARYEDDAAHDDDLDEREDEHDDRRSLASSSDAASVYYDTLEELKMTVAELAAIKLPPSSATAARTAGSSSTADSAGRLSGLGGRDNNSSSSSSSRSSAAARGPAGAWTVPAQWSAFAINAVPADGKGAGVAAVLAADGSMSGHRRELSHEETSQLDLLAVMQLNDVADPAMRTGMFGGQPLPLVLATYGRTDALRLLLQTPARLSTVLQVRDSNGQDALQAAIRHGQFAVADLLLCAGASPDTIDGRGVPSLVTAVLHASASTAASLVDRLITAGANVNCQNVEDGLTPLMMAALIDRQAICSRLLAAGANVNLRNARMEAALMFAASRGNVELVGALLARGGTYAHARKKKPPIFFFEKLGGPRKRAHAPTRMRAGVRGGGVLVVARGQRRRAPLMQTAARRLRLQVYTTTLGCATYCCAISPTCP